MKKKLLLMMLCCPAMLAAQGNGVKVSNFAVNVGTPSTVTFNVSWNRDAMPVALWSDTVWVFVDYNKNGVMERLPVTSATASAGTVTKIPNNDKGVWIAGNARDVGAFSATVQLLTATANVAGACAYASNYPPVGEYTAADKIEFTGTPMYEILLAKPGGGSVTVKAGNTFLPPCDYTVTAFTDKTGAPGSMTGDIPSISGIHQPQGNCPYTEPAVVSTFAGFSSGYSASTYTSLIDERDNKIYPVVKIGGRWIMARNLNYQKGLTWQAKSNSPSTTSGQDLKLIGSFWCPGGDNGNSSATSTLASCDVYGALYSWETAMMLDGYGTWTEVATYSTGAANTDNAKSNQGRTAHSGADTGGRGICPPNWHVPTNNEWGILFDVMEGSGTVHQSASINAQVGTIASPRAKAACMCASGWCSTDTEAKWRAESVPGTDSYGFRALPPGFRWPSGSSFERRGIYIYLWSSSAYSTSHAMERTLWSTSQSVEHGANARSFGFSVRCIRD
jgi:uncharacterized protein (TIGR02145 family)